VDISLKRLQKFYSFMTKCFVFAALVAITSCSNMVNSPDSNRLAKDAVLGPGEWVEFKNPNGSGTATYVSEFARQYDVFEESHKVKLVQRPEKFRHQAGLYNPGSSYSIGAPRQVRFVVQESTAHFEKPEEVEIFLREGSRNNKWVSNGDGYVLGYSNSPSRGQVNLNLFRFYLNGKLLRSIPKQHRYPGFVRIHKVSSSLHVN